GEVVYTTLLSMVYEVRGKLIQLMHTAMVPEQVKTMKIQDGIQVLRTRELRRQLQLWKRFGRLYLIVYVLVRNIKVAELEQDKHNQALEIIKPKKMVKKLEKKNNSRFSGLKRLRKVGGKIEAIDADKDITLVDVETQKEVADMDVELQGRIDDVSAATKDANAAEPTVFFYEEVTMTMAQTLIKMKAEKARLLDEQIAKRLHDEEVEQAAAREKQEKDDFKRAKVLQ
nr:hypothetical protein [Tanacetum cinerariifolium]